MRLTQLSVASYSVIDHIEPLGPDDVIARRLGELGFVPGEPVRMIAHGPLGGDPVAVEIGFTRFALRQAEADRVILRSDPGERLAAE
ncbi:FeoA family protein [Granulibacter bethesdensis]|uniref:FeoA family protein n=1 Tax=Granulibacter bethesdensis TaxID=364410 RepID=UPI0003F1EB35|nr:FeoA family protein [Granulibacter bethesdensis]AHJ65911.1 Ferrous iron transport protein A [Granulibacter bethesdensis CGDNIH4]